MHLRTPGFNILKHCFADTERKRRKYRYMDGTLTQRRSSLEEKIPDIKKTLDMVEYLRDRHVGFSLLTREIPFNIQIGREGEVF